MAEGTSRNRNVKINHKVDTDEVKSNSKNEKNKKKSAVENGQPKSILKAKSAVVPSKNENTNWTNVAMIVVLSLTVGLLIFKIKVNQDGLDGFLQKYMENGNNSESDLKERKIQIAKSLLWTARTLDKIATLEQSNRILESAIETFLEIVYLSDENPDFVTTEMLTEALQTSVTRSNFLGLFERVPSLLHRALKLFPDDTKLLNALGSSYLANGNTTEAKEVFKKVLQTWPHDGFAQAHYGILLKVEDDNMEEGIRFMLSGLQSGAEGTTDSRLYLHLGDAYQRIGDEEKAAEIHDEAVAKGIFLSRHQRSLFNIKHLKSQPTWTIEETTYEPFFRKLMANWERILEEALSTFDSDDPAKAYRKEKYLRKAGEWGQFILFSQGRKNETNCARVPFTCSLIEEFPPAATMKKGESKFSLLKPGTKVFKHAGPVNVRLRSHLGLITPPGAALKVTTVDKLLTWEAGKIFVFDDSYEHEVWHNGDSLRLILLVDVWHPEITKEEIASIKVYP